MKTLKFYICLLTIFCIAILVGCSDSFNSPTALSSQAASSSDVIQSKYITTEEYQRGDFYSSKFVLNPGQTIFLDSATTLLAWITNYEISNCNTNGRADLFISASNIDRYGSLDCSWETTNNFMLKDLSIMNISRSIKKIGVELIGQRGNN